LRLADADINRAAADAARRLNATAESNGLKSDSGLSATESPFFYERKRGIK